MKFLLSILLLFTFGWFVFTNPIYNEDGEGASYFTTVHNIENCNPTGDNGGDTAHGTIYDWTLKKVHDTVYQGNSAIRVEVREDQPLVGGAARVRSEITIFKPQDDAEPFNSATIMPEAWYSYAVYFPQYGMLDDTIYNKLPITQWFEDGGDDCSVKVRKGKLCFENIASYFDLFGAANASPETAYQDAANNFVHLPYDQWHVFVFHFIHSQSSDGLIEIWRDGTKLQTIAGANMHTSTFPKWKIGLYAPDYTEHPGRSLRSNRVIFFDNIRVGKADATYSDMVSDASEDPPAEDPPTINATKARKKYKSVNLPQH